MLNDVFDYRTSIGTIAALFDSAVRKAQQIHTTEDLSGIKVTANDELFHHNIPILSGIDTRSLYCYLLSPETHRDEDTWAIKLMDCQQKGFNPERTLGDDASGLVSGHKIAFPNVPYHYDIFHLYRGLMDLRRFFRNRLKTAITEGEYFLQQSQKWPKDIRMCQQRIDTQANETKARTISKTLDTLISWLEHDILNKAGPTKNQRRELYNFVVEEFKKLEVIEPHRIATMRITLENKREAALGFVEVLEVKFAAIRDQFSISMESIWSMCVLQRCHGTPIRPAQRIT